MLSGLSSMISIDGLLVDLAGIGLSALSASKVEILSKRLLRSTSPFCTSCLTLL
jgi:hypothetical protein